MTTGSRTVRGPGRKSARVQRQIVHLVTQSWRLFGHGPALDSLAGALDMTRSGAQYHIAQLIAKGWLARPGDGAYTLQVTDEWRPAWPGTARGYQRGGAA